MDGIWLLFLARFVQSPMAALRNGRTIRPKVIEATQFKFEVIQSDLKGHLENTMALETTKMALGGNMHLVPG